MRRFAALTALIAAPALAAPEAAAPDSAAIPQPLLEARWFGLPAQEAPADLWWAGPAQRDAFGPATWAQALHGAGASVPGLVAGPAPGNGTAALIVRHGRAQPGLAVGSAVLPGVPALLPGMFDADLLLAAPPGGVGEAAGGITLFLRRPAAALAGMGEFAAGAFGSRRVLGRFDVPVSAGVRLGLGGHVQHDLGWLANTATGERLNRGQRAGLSGTVDIDLTPTLALALTSVYARSTAGNLPAFACDPRVPADCGGRFAATAQRANPLGQRGEVALHDLRLVHDGGRLRVELAAGFARHTGRLGLDLAGYGFTARTLDDRQSVDLAAEADLGLLTLRGGAGFSEGRNRRDQSDTQAGAVIADRRITQDDSRRHLFGQARLEPGGGLALDAGVRVVRQTLRLAVEDRRAGCGPCLTPAGPAQQAQTLVTPEFALSWRASPEFLLFARSARSARLPGWNLLARTSAELAAQPAETGWHHQAGVKADLHGGRLRLSASGFAARTRALVSPLFGIDPLAMAAASQQPIAMRNHGVDVIAEARPLAQLELAASFGWQQARWRGAVPAGAPARPLYAPDTTGSLSAAWRQPLPGTGSILVPRVAARWRSRMGVSALPVPGLLGGVAPGGWQVAAAVQLEIPDGGWLMSVECDNCLDQTLTDGAVAGLPTLNPPRWWQIRFTRRF